MSYKFETPQPVTPGPALHPGPIIRSAIFEPYGLSVVKAAELMGAHRANLNEVLNGKAALSNDLAYRIEALTGVDAKLLIDMQAGHEWDRDAEKRAGYKAQIQRLPPPADPDEPKARKAAANG